MLDGGIQAAFDLIAFGQRLSSVEFSRWNPEWPDIAIGAVLFPHVASLFIGYGLAGRSGWALVGGRGLAAVAALGLLCAAIARYADIHTITIDGRLVFWAAVAVFLHRQRRERQSILRWQMGWAALILAALLFSARAAYLWPSAQIFFAPSFLR